MKKYFIILLFFPYILMAQEGESSQREEYYEMPNTLSFDKQIFVYPVEFEYPEQAGLHTWQSHFSAKKDLNSTIGHLFDAQNFPRQSFIDAIIRNQESTIAPLKNIDFNFRENAYPEYLSMNVEEDEEGQLINIYNTFSKKSEKYRKKDINGMYFYEMWSFIKDDILTKDIVAYMPYKNVVNNKSGAVTQTKNLFSVIQESAMELEFQYVTTWTYEMTASAFDLIYDKNHYTKYKKKDLLKDSWDAIYNVLIMYTNIGKLTAYDTTGTELTPEEFRTRFPAYQNYCPECEDGSELYTDITKSININSMIFVEDLYIDPSTFYLRKIVKEIRFTQTDPDNGKRNILFVLKKGSFPIRRVFENKYTNPVDSQKIKNEALLTAVQSRNFEKVKSLLAEGADINYRDSVIVNTHWKRFRSPLILAVDSNFTEIATYLLEKNADPNIKNNTQSTLVSSAAFSGNFDLVKLLVAKGAIISDTINDVNPMWSAYIKDRYEIGDFLVKSGGNINQASYKGRTILHDACEYCNTESIKRVLNNGANVNQKEYWDGNTALNIGCYDFKKDIEITKILVEAGADVNNLNKLGERPLERLILKGAEYDNYAGALYLVRKGADINLTDTLGNSIFMHLVEKIPDPEKIKDIFYLFSPDIGIKNRAGKTAADIAAELGKKEFVQFLNSPSRLFGAIKFDEKDAIEIVRQNAPLESEAQRTCLHKGIYYRRTDFMKYVILQKPDLLNSVDYLGRTPLYYAILLHDTITAKMLINAGADITIANTKGVTPFDLAKSKNFKVLMNFMKQKNPKLKSSEPQTLLAGMGKHAEKITNLNLSKSSRYLISISSNDNVIVWDTKSGKQLFSTQFRLSSAEFTNDEKFIILSDYYKIYVWDFFAKEKIRELNKKETFSVLKSGKILYATNDNTVKLYDIASNSDIKEYSGLKFPVAKIIPTINEKTFVTISYENMFAKDVPSELTLWDAETGKILGKFTGHQKLISDADLSADGKTLYASGENGVFYVWNTADQKMIHSSIEDLKFATYLNFSKNGKYLILSARFSGFVLIDLPQMKVRKSYKESAESVTFIENDSKALLGSDYGFSILNLITGEIKEISRNAGFAKISSVDKTKAFATDGTFKIREIDINTGQTTRKFGFQSVPITYFFLDSKNRMAMSLGQKEVIWNYALKNTLEFLQPKEVDKYGYGGPVRISPDGNLIAGSSLWDIRTKKQLKSFQRAEKSYRSTYYSTEHSIRDFSPDGQSMLSLKKDSICVIDLNLKTLFQYPLGKYDYVKSVKFSPDAKKIIFTTHAASIIDIESKTATGGFHYVGGKEYTMQDACFSPDGKTALTCGAMNEWGKMFEPIFWFNVADGKLIHKFEGHTGYINSAVFSPDGKRIASGADDFDVKLWDTDSLKCIKTFAGHTGTVDLVQFHPNGKRLFSSARDNTIKIWDIESMKEAATILFIDSADWIIFTPDGRFDGTENGINQLYFTKGTEILNLRSMYDKFYTPDLMKIIASGQKLDPVNLSLNEIKLPPVVRIQRSDNKTEAIKTSVEKFQISSKIFDTGAGIDEVRLYHNGKLIATKNKDFKLTKDQSGTSFSIVQFSANLMQGENILSVSAFNKQRTESMHDAINVVFEPINKKMEPECNLYIFAIGINKYKNPKYNLTYCLPDAQAFVDTLKKGSSAIFKHTYTYFLSDQSAVKDSIINCFNKVKTKAKMQDVFVFYYAGHGVMSSDTIPEFYIVPHDVTSLYGDPNILKQKAVSSMFLRDISRQINAQKQLFILDACQSGGAVDIFSSRGAAEEKAIMQLARSAGVSMFSASSSDQSATEFHEIGHGVFTYSILEGLRGLADGGNSDKKITINELKSYIDDRVPDLSEKYRGQAQFPQCIIKGMDFPVVIVK